MPTLDLLTSRHLLVWFLMNTLALILMGWLFAGASGIVEWQLQNQAATIAVHSQAHRLSPALTGAILRNEMLGTEEQLLHALLPGADPVRQLARDGLLGLHFLTIKQAHWNIKAGLALAGVNTTVGWASIRPSVGQEILDEVAVSGANTRPAGLAGHVWLIRELTTPQRAIAYLAANLERGSDRLPPTQRDDWTALARWHNTGVMTLTPDVPPALWAKGSNYVLRVGFYLEAMSHTARSQWPDSDRPMVTLRLARYGIDFIP